jgi:ubiquinone/menaquinone biosynthesis C-methylase UbiE
MGHKQPKEDEMLIVEKHEPILEEINAVGFILDIGGGGEGVIGQLMTDQVIAIDKNKRELEEAPSENLKIVMDATDLKFLDNSFETVTAFCSLMYMNSETKKQVFKEVHRVLRKDGKFLIWDVTVPEKPDEKLKYFVLPLNVKLPHKTIETGFGVPFFAHDKNYFLQLGKKTGFDVKVQEDINKMFYLEFVKK